MATTREDALASKLRFGKVDIGAHFIYGQIIDVHSGGDYFLFQRGHSGNYKPKWYHRAKLDGHLAHTPSTTGWKQVLPGGKADPFDGGLAKQTGAFAGLA